MAALKIAGLAALVFAVLYAISRVCEWCGEKARDAQPPTDPKIVPAGRVKAGSFGARYKRF